MDMSQYRELFLTETREHIGNLNRLIVQLEQNPSHRETVDALFREAHSIKGMAATMGFDATARLAHHLEDLLDGFRSSGDVPSTTIDYLLEGIDLFAGLLEDLQANRPERDTDAFMAKWSLSAAATKTDQPTEPVAEVSQGPFIEDRRKGDRRERDDTVRTVRVSTGLLDEYVNLTGELITHRNMLNTALSHRNWDELNEALTLTGRLIDDLHHHVLQGRLMPLASITGRLPRIVRDLCRKTGKRVTLHQSGTQIGMDRSILEELTDPLVHLVRNAVDHGIEREGVVEVSARRERGLILVEVADDGRGMDPERIRQKAVARGLISASQAEALSDRAALTLVCQPGFSTAEHVTETSGRGVGMDVVKAAVQGLGGTLDILSAPGAGTRFQMRLPLSIAIIKIFLVNCAGGLLAIPVTRVQRALELATREILSHENRRSFRLDEESIPLYSLAEALCLPHPAAADTVWVCLTEVRGQQVGLQVDGFLGQRDAFIKPLGFPLNRLNGLSGATLEGDGRVVFLIDPQSLLEKHQLST